MKKRLFSFVLAVVMVFTTLIVIPTSVSAVNYDDYNDDYFELSTADDLMEFAASVDTETHFEHVTVVLTNDIDLFGKSWQGVGYAAGSGAYFSGRFDGQGHSITNIAASAGNNDFYGALFRELGDGAVVENVALYGTITVTRTKTGNSSYFGTVAAALRPGNITIQNVYSAVDLDGSHLEDFSATNCGWNAVGGLVGTFLFGNETFLTIDSCVYAGTITANCTGNGSNRPYAFGGLVGMLNGPSSSNHRLYIKDSAFLGTVNVKSMNHFGAFVGQVYDNATSSGKNLVWIDNSYAAGTVSIQPHASPRAKYNGYLVGAFGYYLKNGNDSSLTESNCTNRIYFQNCYYVSAKYSHNSNTENTFDQLSGNQRITATQNRQSTDRANFASLSPSTTLSGNTGGPYFNVNDITAANLCSMTAVNTNFTEPENWHFFADGQTFPLPTYIYETYFSGSAPVSTDILIGTAEELAALATTVNGGSTLSDKTVKLTADITLGSTWTSIGVRDSKPFCGTFDGQGHTITFGDHTVSSSITGGLFGYLGDGAVVQNVKLAGTIRTSGALNFFGIVSAAVTGTVQIRNVLVSTNVNFGGNMYYCGGFVGFMENNAAVNLTIDSCVVDGILNFGNQAQAVGAFVGYTGNTNTTKYLTITNSLWAGNFNLNDPSYSTRIGGFVGYQKSSSDSYPTIITIQNCIAAGKFNFDKSNNKDWTAKARVLGMVIGSSCTGDDGSNDSSKNCPVTMTNVYYRDWNNWAGTAIARNNMCTSPVTAPSYTNADQKTPEEIAALTGSAFSDASKWNLGTETDLPCPASIVTTFGRPESTTGFVEEVTTIEVGTAEALAAIATAVNTGNTYEGKSILLTADIELGNSWSSIGVRSSYPFRGTFDGQGHTITFGNHTVSSDTTGGLFGYLGNGAIVQNVKLDGTIALSGARNFFGTVSAAVTGTVAVRNVWSAVTVNAGGNLQWSGGMIGFMEHYATVNLTMDSCVADGLMNFGAYAQSIGAFVGYTGNNGSVKNLTITNSLWCGQIALNSTEYSTRIGGFVGYQKANGDSAYTNVTIKNCISAGKMTFGGKNSWTGDSSRQLAMVIGASCLGDDGSNDSAKKCPVILTNVYYRNWNNWEGTPLARNNMCTSPVTAPVYTNADQKTMAQIVALSGSAFEDASKWNCGASTQVPCPASVVTTFGYPAGLTLDAYDIYDTFEVGTADALIAIATAVASGKTYSGKTVVLTTDINLASVDWVSIGTRGGTAFRGTFNGQGYTISNLTATAGGDTTGALFGFVGAGAVIKNFSLTGTITATADANFLATVINCVEGSVTLQNVRSTVRLMQSGNGLKMFYSGGLVGFMNNDAATNLTIDGCVYDGTINTGGQTHFLGGIIGYTGLNAYGGAKTLTITNTAFSGQINLNDPGYFEGNSCFIGFANKGDKGLTVTVNDCVSTGKISYNRSKTWSSNNSYAYNGVLIGQVKDGTTLSVSHFYYTPVTVGEGELTAIGLQGETYGASNAGATKKTVEEMAALTGSVFSDSSKWKFTANETFVYYFPCPASFPAIAVSKMLEQARVTAEARNTNDSYKGIRFVGTFYNAAACHNAGTQAADFGMLLISADLYSEDLNTYDALVAAGAKVAKAIKYKVVDGSYVIHAVVYGIPDGCKDVSLVAIPYMSDYLGEATLPISYNTVFN